MNKAAETVYTAIRRDGTQSTVIDTMQTREELYQAINYYEYEKALLDQTLGKKTTGRDHDRNQSKEVSCTLEFQRETQR
jgi:methylisocitrate lyase